MLSQNKAVEAARAFLAQVPFDRPYTIVMQPELTVEHPVAWAVRFDSQEHLDTGDPGQAPFTRVLLVPKDGTAPHFPPSHLRVEEYLAYVRHGGWREAAKGGTARAEPWQRALRRLLDLYGGRVELAATHPVAEDAGTWLFACRPAETAGRLPTPMLTASVVVPKDGGQPYHPAANDPWGDASAYTRSPSARDSVTQSRRLNARGCVVSVASGIAGSPSTPVPWQPDHETSDWWEQLLGRYFPGAQVLRCATWDQVVVHAREPGPDTQGVVWVRRTVGGVEASGHLLYVHNNKGDVVFLDGMTGGLARLDTVALFELVFARMLPGSVIR
ncbi:toxin glutamine deamidase domain-containing protein [Streptomyces sp. FIT100]|uniref:toxin glutamine deamidase domain-containing protein n=1 Tax=Streptomyces sp. FIT100 TaxID=2837956 RepID=UPI0021C91A7B|nr:toxin glutamine deamidase domain-containing protein [Streptomyces sp. FIT100]UUN29518.1 YrhB family protein [Streptomyces sp. FIT100]